MRRLLMSWILMRRSLPITIPVPKLLGNLLNQLWMVQLERESHNSCGNEQLLFSFYCSDDWARKPYSLIELLLDDGFKLALKSVFSEIWVRTWVQTGLWLAVLSDLPNRELFFWRETTWTWCPDSDLKINYFRN